MNARVLVVTNMWPGERNPYYGIFVQRQVEALRRARPQWTFDVFTMAGHRGRIDYLAAVPRLRRVLAAGYDLVHAHYGLAGATAALAGADPLVMTLHGGDVNIGWQRPLTRLAARRSAAVIAVSERLKSAFGEADLPVISCGVSTETFRPRDRAEARRRAGIREEAIVLLFPADPSVPVKDYPLFQEAMARVAASQGAEVVELALGVAADEVPWRMAAADVVVLTSKEESGPLVVKEAVACGIPAVAVDVGDAASTLRDLPGCAIVPRTPDAIAEAVIGVLESPDRGRGPEADALRRQRVFDLGLDEASIAERVAEVYETVLDHRGVGG
jgi:teichuronic acid biosynthesis glycosyltransferase TuaC